MVPVKQKNHEVKIFSDIITKEKPNWHKQCITWTIFSRMKSQMDFMYKLQRFSPIDSRKNMLSK